MDKTSKPEWKVPWKGMVVALLVSAGALAVIFWQISSPRRGASGAEGIPSAPLLWRPFLCAGRLDRGRAAHWHPCSALGQSIPWWELTIVLGAANFLTLVTPFAGGGGALIVYYLYRRGLKASRATAVVLGGGLAGSRPWLCWACQHLRCFPVYRRIWRHISPP